MPDGWSRQFEHDNRHLGFIVVPAYPEWATTEEVLKYSQCKQISDGRWCHLDNQYVLFIEDRGSLILCCPWDRQHWEYLCPIDQIDRLYEVFMERLL